MEVGGLIGDARQQLGDGGDRHETPAIDQEKICGQVEDGIAVGANLAGVGHEVGLGTVEGEPECFAVAARLQAAERIEQIGEADVIHAVAHKDVHLVVDPRGVDSDSARLGGKAGRQQK
jgi:hypothetical protein